MPSTKVVILNWNGVSHLRKFLPSVIRATPAQHQIIVVDNGSTDDSVEVLKSEFAQINLICFSENHGYAGGYNKALEQLESDYFLLLNSDVEPKAGYLDTLIDTLERNPNTVAVAPKLLSYCQRDTFEYAGASGGFIDYLGYPFCRGRIFKHTEQDRGQYNDEREVFWASGACMLVRGDIFKSLGGFDSSFFAHMEEIDFCWRAKNAGYSVRVNPNAEVYHLGGGTLNQDSPFKLKLNYRNNLAMMYKNLPRNQRLVSLVLRMSLDGLSALIYLISGKTKYFKAVIEAHREFYAMNLTPGKSSLKPSGVYKGSIILRYFLGKKTFPKSLF